MNVKENAYKRLNLFELTELFNSIKGKFRLRGYENKSIPENFDYRIIYRKHLEDKYTKK